MNRVEFGFSRTFSTSPKDVECCKIMSGYLIPNDLQRIADFLGCDPFELAKNHLMASPGAIILSRGEILRLPTLVPYRNGDGQCKFLENDRCTIHAVAPYACAFFDYNMPDEEADPRAQAGITALFDVWVRKQDPMLYASMWQVLKGRGQIAAGPEERRKLLDD